MRGPGAKCATKPWRSAGSASDDARPEQVVPKVPVAQSGPAAWVRRHDRLPAWFVRAGHRSTASSDSACGGEIGLPEALGDHGRGTVQELPAPATGPDAKISEGRIFRLPDREARPSEWPAFHNGRQRRAAPARCQTRTSASVGPPAVGFGYSGFEQGSGGPGGRLKTTALWKPWPSTAPWARAKRGHARAGANPPTIASSARDAVLGGRMGWKTGCPMPGPFSGLNDGTCAPWPDCVRRPSLTDGGRQPWRFCAGPKASHSGLAADLRAAPVGGIFAGPARWSSHQP